MKIMYISHEGGEDFNGASRSMLALISDAAKNRGDILYVVVPLKSGRLVEEVLALPNTNIIVAKPYRWKRVQSNNTFKRVLKKIKYVFYEKPYNYLLAKKISRLVKKEDIEIIHSNSSVINLGGLVHRITGVPHVWHVREFGEEDFDMYPMDSRKFFYRFLYKNSTRIICISKAICNKINLNMPTDKTEVIYNGVKIPEKILRDSKPGNILISGFISVKKGQWIAVEAVDILRNRGINVNLYIAGKGDLHTLGEKYEKNKDCIHLLGFINDMQSIREQMDIEVMCSVSEGFGRTVVEAMAAELIIIAANGGASPELIDENVNGFLFNVNDPENLADVIEKVLKLGDDEKQKIRTAGRVSAKLKYSEELYVNNIRDVYRKIKDL